jgi:hypothetical protein
MPNIIQLLINLFRNINKKEEDLIPQGTNTPSVQIIVPAPITLPVLTAGKKRGLFLGINDYPGSSNDLRGCLNDDIEWISLLKDCYKLDEITNLTNSQCTIANVKKYMTEIINVSMPNDVLIIQYSGHGSYRADMHNDEIDGKDEAIVMYDGFIIDDEIEEMLSKIKNGVRTTIILDSCFSGSGTRSFNFNDESFYRVGRFMPPKDNGKIMGLKIKSRVFRSIGKTEEEMNHILISGCSDSEVSYDAEFNGKYYGAMSYYATKVLRENPMITYTEFYKKLREKLPSSMYPQTPQLEGKSEFKNIIMFS